MQATHKIVWVLCCTLMLWGVARAQEEPQTDPPPAQQSEPADQNEPAAEKQAEGDVSFKNDVAPILVRSCLGCHGQVDPQSEYQLHTFELAMQEAPSGSPAITPGKPDESELYLLVSEEDEDVRMPQEGDPLSEEEIELIRRWIEQGAKFDGPDPKAALASIIPRAAHPEPPEVYRVTVPVTAVAFRPDGQELAVGGYREVTIWNPSDGSLLRRIKNVAERVYGLEYSPDGKLLAVAAGVPGQLGEISLLDPAEGKLVRSLTAMADVAFDVAFSPDGSRLAGCAADRSIHVFDVASGKEELLIEDHADWVMAVCWNHDGSRLASASRDKTSKVFDAASGDAQTTYPGHGDGVFGVAFSADGKQAYTAGRDKKIHVWNPEDGKKIAEIGGFGHEVYEVVVRGGQIFSCSADKTARQHGIEKRDQIRSYAGHQDWVYTLAYNEGTKQLATGSYDGEVRIWNTEDGASLAVFIAAPGYKPAESSEPAAAP